MSDFESDWYGDDDDTESAVHVDPGDSSEPTILIRILTPPLALLFVLFASRWGRLGMSLAIAGAVGWAFVSTPLTAAADGEVVSLSSLGCCRGTIGFSDMDGEIFEFHSGRAGQGREVGEAIEVFYNPDDPTEADITRITDGMWAGVYALFLLIVLPAIFPLIRRVGDWERRRKGISSQP